MFIDEPAVDSPIYKKEPNENFDQFTFEEEETNWILFN